MQRSQFIEMHPALRPTRFLARQPILDARRCVLGYELLFRSGWENSFHGESNDSTRKMLDNCVMMGIESLANHGLAFVNCTREALVKGMVTLLPPANTVLEILETVEPDVELVEACIALRGMGYRLALDDFVARPEMSPLIEIASFIKVDFRLSDIVARQRIRSMVRDTKAELLAEKIENQDEFDVALREGYKYFQGYFFCRPKLYSDREIPQNRLNYLRLLVEVTRTPINLSEVEHIVRSEASLFYRLLRLANSAMMGMQTEIKSFVGAMMAVGDDRFRSLVSVAVSSTLGGDQPTALIRMALERARFCELVAPLIDESPAEQYMLGLLSLVDAMLQHPMASIVNSLPLRDEAKDALLGAKNAVAVPLCLVKSFESGDWGPGSCAANDLGIPEETLASLYMESLRWAADALSASPVKE